MKPVIIKLNPNSIKLAAEKAAEVLKSGGIVVHPTDTCYGIAANVFDQAAVEKTYAFKGRNYNKPFNIIVRDFEQMKKYGYWHPLIEEIIRQNPRKMFSFVLPRKKTVPPRLNPDYQTIGIQIPKFSFSQALLELVNFPLIATSANLSGMENNYSPASFLKQMEKAEVLPDLIIDGGRLPFREPSAVVGIKDGKIVYLRK
jgi:L-threonylcarbamoyladenylate synthase